MKKELWLEFGAVDSTGFHHMFWYNEGRWQELPYFIKNFFHNRKRSNMYYFWRYGSKNHYLRNN